MKKILQGILLFLNTFFVSLFFFGVPVFSQADFEQAIKEIDRPVREDVEKALVKTPPDRTRPEDTPEKETLSGPRFFVSSILLEGLKTLSQEDFSHILSEYEGRELYDSQIRKTLTRKISREYLRRGIIATCFVPPQEIEDGVVKLTVIESSMGNLKIVGGRFFSPTYLRTYWPIYPGQVLRYDEMLRALRAMNKNPDREVNATLLPGEKPGTTDVLLEQKDEFPVHFIGSLDNEGGIYTGKTRFRTGVLHNNLLGFDDTLLAGYAGSRDSGGFYIYHQVPAPVSGTTFLYGYSRAKAFPKKEFEEFNITSTAETASFFIYQDLFRGGSFSGQLSAGFEAKNKHLISPPTGGTFINDRLRILRVGLSLVDQTDRTFTFMRPEISQGINLFGAKRKSEFSSRQAENTFSKLTLDSRFSHRFRDDILAQIRFTGQLSSEKLMPQEQLFMGGLNSVRGYPSGDFLADTGYAANFEVLSPLFFIPGDLKLPYGENFIREEIRGLLFFDHGFGMKRGLMQGERSQRRMASLGAGLRMKIFNQAELRLEWGLPLEHLADRRLSTGGRNDPWFHFSINFKDNFPREISRLLNISRSTPSGE